MKKNEHICKWHLIHPRGLKCHPDYDFCIGGECGGSAPDETRQRVIEQESINSALTTLLAINVIVLLGGLGYEILALFCSVIYMTISMVAFPLIRAIRSSRKRSNGKIGTW